mgnify:CR=1 FL=1
MIEVTPTSVKPLNEVVVQAPPRGTLSVRDGLGREYVRQKAGRAVAFEAAGALGNHVVALEDANGRIVETTTFRVDCQTEIEDADGEFKELLGMLQWTLSKWGEGNSCVRWRGKLYRYFVCWLRDHVHTLKGMKYFAPELKTAIELYRDSQREDGMIWDNIHPRTPHYNTWQWSFDYDGFLQQIEDGWWEFKRIPVENDVEYLFVEGLYYTWKATGDDAWMASCLDAAVRAYGYSTTSPYRWSRKHRLLKRGFTIDTWDFQSDEDTARTGHTMVVKPGVSRFGIMHGDNTGFAVGCRYLAEMLERVGRKPEAKRFRKLGADIQRRLDKLAWNSRFFTHHVPEDPRVVRDLGVDQAEQVSLSNAYDLNRGITHEQCVAIIKTYQRIRRRMPKSSPGEFYQIYPPFERGFGPHNAKWDYMNGGVTTIVAGELAHGAFEHGFEAYGADILRRVAGWGKAHNGYLHCTLRGALPKPPKRRFTPLDLKAQANVDFAGKGAPGVPGWTSDGANDLHEMPPGRHVFHGIPFDVIDPAMNGRRAAVGLRAQGGYALERCIPVRRQAASIYFLHTDSRGHDLVGTIRLRYADGEEHVQYVNHNQQVGPWWMPSDPPYDHHQRPVCKVAWRGANERFRNIGVYAYGLDNPRPDAGIAEIVLEASQNGSFWGVLAVTLCDRPVFFMPSDVSYGIPDNWGAGAVVYALVEGLAGIKDAGVAFDRVTLTPRWEAAGVRKATACAKYEASGGYLRYRYSFAPRSKRLTLEFAGSGSEFGLALLLPKGLRPRAATLDGRAVPVATRRVEGSAYACLDVCGVGAHRLALKLA